MAIATKTNRIDIRLTDSDKSLIEKAASLSKQSVSSYIISVVTAQAQIDIEKNDKVTLSRKDWNLIAKLLNNPGEPNEELKRLLSKIDD